ncbi:MAG: 8-oxo-dGTP diphosphatase [Chlamydiae bacterium]|nr:8-oxo-dGTP diphosphatase [Chlamydiota bacterium]
MQIKVGIGILVLNERKVLLGKRKNSHGEGTWGFPGGHLEFGETVTACTTRELEEETGLLAKTVIEGPWREVLYPKENKHHLSLFTFVSEFSGNLENKEPHKTENWQWFDVASLPSPVFEPIKKISTENSLELFLEENFNVDPRFGSML